MPVLIAFLRAVNVGGNAIIKMAALKELFDELGFKDARTLLQSGNVVFRARATPDAAAKKIAAAIRKTFALDIDVTVRSAEELRKTAAANPFPAAARDDPSHLVVTFLLSEPSAAAIKSLKDSKFALEKFEVRGKHTYTHYAKGIGTSKLTPALIEKTLQTRGTGRNWNTVTKLIAVADEMEAAP